MSEVESNEVPIEIISHIVFLLDVKKLAFVATCKIFQEKCSIKLTRQYSLEDFSENHKDLICNLEYEALTTSNVNFKNLVKLSIKYLCISENYTLPETLEKIYVHYVCSEAGKFVTLPKSTRKFTVRKNACEYFPFILNKGLKFLKINESLDVIPESVEYFYSIANAPVPGKKINIWCRNSKALVILSNGDFIHGFHPSITKVNLDCWCPEYIEVPSTVRKFKLRDCMNGLEKTIKFVEGVKTIKINCVSLSVLTFPQTVKSLTLFLDYIKKDIIAPCVEFLSLQVVEVSTKEPLVFPKNIKHMLLGIIDDTVLNTVVFPENLEILSCPTRFSERIPVTVKELTLCQDKSNNADLSHLCNLQTFHVRIDLKSVTLPPSVKKLTLTEYSSIGYIPDTIVDLTLPRSWSKNIPKSLQKLRIDINHIHVALKDLKVDRSIKVYYTEDFDGISVGKSLIHSHFFSPHLSFQILYTQI